MREIILINITNKDHPKLTTTITNILTQDKMNILNINQTIIHDTLSFDILIKIPNNATQYYSCYQITRNNKKHINTNKPTPHNTWE